MKTQNEIKNELLKPFKIDELEFRIGRCGKTNDGKIWATCLTYITSRAVMNRLDDVFGVFGWKDEYKELDNGFICKLSVKDSEGNWISKEDVAEKTNVEALKGGFSDALKRTAVKFGIGRYLYRLEESFVQVVDKNTKGAIRASSKNTGVFYYLPPQLPKWALEEDYSESFSESVDKLDKEINKIKQPSPKQLECLRKNVDKLTEEEKQRLSRKEVSSSEASDLIHRVLGK